MGPVSGDSSDPNVPAVEGESSAAGTGVRGVASKGGGMGVYGECAGGHGVHGKSVKGRGVVGMSDDFQGVYGHSISNSGVVGESDNMHAVFGNAKGSASSGVYGTNSAAGDTGAGVYGENPGGDGVVGTGRRGVVGNSDDYQGVYGHSNSSSGVVGESQDFDGVWGQSHNPKHAGVSGHNPGGLAGYFDGNVVVTGDIQLAGADIAEQFEFDEPSAAAAGTVVVIDDVDRVRSSDRPYDRRVAGVVSGAGNYRPGVMLDDHGHRSGRQPLALVGKVFCKVDASYASIVTGDLLTTSATPGHAMKVTDRAQAPGAVLGKAMAPLGNGTGLLPILVTLQ
jgi:hypothetical protein